MSDEFMPFPTQSGGEPDYEEAVDEMFGHEPTPTNPVYINDGAETLMLVERDLGDLTVADPYHVLNPQTWTVTVEEMWNEWVNGELTFRRRKFLRVEDGDYDTESHIALSRLSAAILADEANDVTSNADRDELVVAIQEVYDALDYDGEVVVE